MSLHLIKLCVGVSSIEDLAAWQKEWLAEERARGEKRRLFHKTLQTPKRQAELLAGGSIYWIIKGLIQVRQRLLAFDEGQREDGSPCCLIVYDKTLVPVRPTPRRPFQGWRYLKADDAPPDLPAGASDGMEKLPPAMRRELAELGLL